MRGFLLAVLVGFFLSLYSPALAKDKEADAQQFFQDWSTFQDEVACWASTESLPEEDAKENIMYVAFFMGSQSPQISFVVPNCCDEPADAASSSATVQLKQLEDTFFLMGKELDFLRSLLKSDSVIISTRKSKELIDTFSLLGFRDAYNQLARMCNFHPIGQVGDAAGIDLS